MNQTKSGERNHREKKKYVENTPWFLFEYEVAEKSHCVMWNYREIKIEKCIALFVHVELKIRRLLL